MYICYIVAFQIFQRSTFERSLLASIDTDAITENAAQFHPLKDKKNTTFLYFYGSDTDLSETLPQDITVVIHIYEQKLFSQQAKIKMATALTYGKSRINIKKNNVEINIFDNGFPFHLKNASAALKTVLEEMY